MDNTKQLPANLLSKRVIRLFLSLFLSLNLALALALPRQAFAYEPVSTEDLLVEAEDALAWIADTIGVTAGEHLLSSQALMQYCGSSFEDWLALTIGRLGASEGAERYLSSLKDYVTRCYQSDALLDSRNATEWHRIGLTVLALGGDPTAFGVDPNGQPINLVADGTYYRGNTNPLGAQGLNAYIFALLLLDAGDYSVPADAVDTRQSIIASILAAQADDGGFCLSAASSSSVDITAMALQALAPYYESWDSYDFTPLGGGAEQSKPVWEAIDAALSYLSGEQDSQGNFAFAEGEASAETTCQVIIALCSLGIDPLRDVRFIKEGSSTFDGLMIFQNEDGGFAHQLASEPDGSAGFLADGSSDLGASREAASALVTLARYNEGMNTLYDMTPETSSLWTFVPADSSLLINPATSQPIDYSAQTATGTSPVVVIGIIGGVVVAAGIAAFVLVVMRRRR